MSMTLLWTELCLAALIILGASNFLTKSADVIALKTGLGRSFVGIVMLATATSLPEMGTGISAVSIVGTPDLAIGAAFGSNLFNLLIIAVLDIFWRNGPILSRIDRTSITVCVFGIVIVLIAAMAVWFHDLTTVLSDWYVSPISVILCILFLGAIYTIYLTNRHASVEKNKNELSTSNYDGYSVTKAFTVYLIAATIVVITAIWLAQIGDQLATVMNWKASFVGTQFLAFITSLPELATSFAALRLNAPELAITNVLGSNLFNMSFVLLFDDLAYTKGVVWTAVSNIHSITAIIAIVMTLVVLVSLMIQPRKRLGKYLTYEACLLIMLYIFGSVITFILP